MLTRVVAVRHAKPVDRALGDPDLQPLSEEGISTQRIITERLKKMEIVPDLIFCSPLLRARQTAEVISEIYGKTPVKTVEALGNHFNEQELLKLLPDPINNETLFLVGHAPTLGEFINRLVGDNVLPAGLSKSSAAIVDFREKPAFGKGEFFGYYQPS